MDAPKRATIEAALQLLLKDENDCFEERDGFMTIKVNVLDNYKAGRNVTLATCGFLCFLHIFALGAAPTPISPFLLAHVMDGYKAFSLDEKFMENVAPELIAKFKPWFEWTDRNKPPSSGVMQLAQECYVDVRNSIVSLHLFCLWDQSQMSLNRNAINIGEYKRNGRKLLLLKAMGEHAEFLETRQDYQSFQRGFDYPVNVMRSVLTVRSKNAFEDITYSS